jgi:hypothetical protein
MNQVNGGWEADQESFHQAWVDVYKVLSGDKYHFGPVEGEPVMGSLDSWYAKAWSGISGGREYAGHLVNSQGLITGNMAPITGMAPTPGFAKGSNFAFQLSKQFSKDGPKSIIKSYNTIQRRLLEHESKLSGLQYKSSVEREIRTFKTQIETIEKFMKSNGIIF